MGIKVLLGDTSPITRKVFALSLEALDASIIYVETEKEAREIMEKENPDLVVLSSNITDKLKELVDDITGNFPDSKIIILKSPFEKLDIDETKTFKVFIKPVPSSKIRELISEIKSLKEVSKEFPEESFTPPEEEIPSPEEELSEEELQAKTWESHSKEEVFPEEEMFPEEEIHEDAFMKEESEEFGKEEIFQKGEEEEGISLSSEEIEIAEEEIEKPGIETTKETEKPFAQPVSEEKEEEIITAKPLDIEEKLKSMAPEIIEKIAWEVIPPLAEKIIREEIEKIKKSIEES